ncbi:uncharacterized protein DC041_0003382, partial [Schistosoma bovis]
DELFILDELMLALDIDTLMLSRPVIYPANTAIRIITMFDSITYDKAIPVFSRAQILNDLFSLANILPDLRFITYCTAIRHGGHEEWKFLESQLILNETVNEIENENKMLALTCSLNKEIMKRYLERVRENKNFWFTLDYFAKSPVGNQLLWDHLSDVNNFDKHK